MCYMNKYDILLPVIPVICGGNDESTGFQDMDKHVSFNINLIWADNKTLNQKKIPLYKSYKR